MSIKKAHRGEGMPKPNKGSAPERKQPPPIPRHPRWTPGSGWPRKGST
jgi:hypothetical protein